MARIGLRALWERRPAAMDVATDPKSARGRASHRQLQNRCQGSHDFISAADPAEQTQTLWERRPAAMNIATDLNQHWDATPTGT